MTSKLVDYTNRKLRFFEKSRHEWRRRRIVRFVLPVSPHAVLEQFLTSLFDAIACQTRRAVA